MIKFIVKLKKYLWSLFENIQRLWLWHKNTFRLIRKNIRFPLPDRYKIASLPQWFETHRWEKDPARQGWFGKY